MKLLFDARWILLEDRFDGVSRYSHELARALAERDDLEITWLIHDMRQLDKLPKGDYLLANDPNNITAELFNLARTINASGHSLVYSPFFMMGTLGKRYNLVLTIHDLIYFKHRTPPQWLPWHVRAGWWLFHATYWPMRWQLNRANAIATVSETAKQELLAARATKRPIVTVPNAVAQEFTPNNTSAHYQSNDIVYMGAFTPYKNVECLIHALRFLPEATLHLCSKVPPIRKKQLSQLAESVGVSDRITWHNGIPDTAYRELLNSARCSISASKIEGFGLSVLEAQAQGVPMVCSDIPIFHEVGGDGVLYFDESNPEHAAKVIADLSDESTSTALIERGYENAQRYTWQASAEAASAMLHTKRT